jgi:DNA-binding NarL/FixJ family response regulator
MRTGNEWEGALATTLQNKVMALLVEDHRAFRHELERLLQARYPKLLIEKAESGEEALEKLDDFAPDLVFMDIQLPGVSGLEVTRQLKARYPHAHVIILTAHDDEEYREAARHAGGDRFLTKDTPLGDIWQAVESGVQGL